MLIVITPPVNVGGRVCWFEKQLGFDNPLWLKLSHLFMIADENYFEKHYESITYRIKAYSGISLILLIAPELR
jgi:hypothetical protein